MGHPATTPLATALLGSLAVLLVVVANAVQVRRRRHALLPPGPPSGLFGTQLPPGYSWRTFEGYTKQFGDLFTVWLGPNPLVVIGTYKAAMKIMERDSGNFPDRPLSMFAGKTMSGDMRLLFVGYGDRWRTLRKLMHAGLQPRAASSYEPIQSKAARTFITDILKDPDQFQNHAHKYAASIVMSITYGKLTPTEYSDPEVVAVGKCLSRLSEWARPGAALVDSYPILRFLPGQWKVDGKRWHEEEKALFMKQLDKVRQDMSVDCFGKYVIEHQRENNLSDEEAAYLAGSLFGAGSDTTASALTIGIMAMTLFPEKTKQAQEELDRVIGRSRAPTFNDEQDLPFVRAFIQEIHRWRPVSSGGFAHAALEDYVHDGFVIPKGCSVVANHWSISRDETVFHDPDTFIPERWFVNEDPATGEIRRDINHVQFGFGRRVCAGKQVAMRSLFVNTALLLWAFSFAKAKDAAGKEIPIDDLAFTNAANSHPLPFRCSITPRFEEVASILAEESESA